MAGKYIQLAELGVNLLSDRHPNEAPFHYRVYPCLSAPLFLFVLQSPVFSAVTPEPRVETAILAGGCFWCIEADYEKLDGVLDVVSGYTGGQLKDPTYKQVSAGNSGHIEAVEVSFDANTISYAEILDYFWRHIDPTRNDGQFCDRGPQYRPAIFYATPRGAGIGATHGREQAVLRAVKSGTDCRDRVLPGGRLSPGLLQKEFRPLQLLPLQMWSRRTY